MTMTAITSRTMYSTMSDLMLTESTLEGNRVNMLYPSFWYLFDASDLSVSSYQGRRSREVPG